MPQVSVVIPTFGRPELVCRAVRGVLAQTFADIEVIVVVDGDDPATRQALGQIGDDRLRAIQQPEKRGASAARNAGADAASGEWVAFLDDDDEWLPEKLASQLAAAPPGPAIVMTLSKVVSAAATFVRPSRPYAGDMPIDEWLFGRHSWTRGGESFVQTSSLMIPRALFADLRFAETAQHEEWEFVIRAVKQHGLALATVPEALVVYYVPEKRTALSHAATWRRSLEWALSMRGVLTRRAFSGFCLTVVAQMAATTRSREAFVPLFRAALRDGAPTARQIAAFCYFRASPEKLRRRIRAALQGERKAA
jgi:glycosyltransferase involved in cell wall biosynthesis